MVEQADIIAGEFGLNKDRRPNAPGWRFRRLSSRPLDLGRVKQPVFCNSDGSVQVWAGMGVYLRIDRGGVAEWWEAIPTPDKPAET